MKRLWLSVVCCLTALTGLGQIEKYPLKITPLTEDLFVYVSHGFFRGKPYAANAVYLVTAQGVVLFDTPWDKAYYQPLLDSIWNRHHQKVILCISTHFHDDRTGGLAYYRSKGIRTYTTAMTDSLSKANHNNRAACLFSGDTSFHVGRHAFQTYYPGPGHSPDNIVIWFPKEKVLYAGCLVKSVAADNLGNLTDASVAAWGKSLKKLQHRFPHPAYVIVGHNGWRDKRSIMHTLAMITAYEKKHP